MKAYHSRIYAVNEDFFGVWSPNMAYVLGFWFADGYMRKERSYRILFVSNDQLHLHDVRRVMGSAHPVRSRPSDDSWELSICSKRLFTQLKARGGTRAKSRKMVFPYIPSKYLRDFIRGYFDGDGSVFITTYRSTKDGKVRHELRSNFTSGSIRFLKHLMGLLIKNLRAKKKVIGKYNDGHSLKLGYGMRDTRRILRYMYYLGFPIGMARKARFLQY